MALTEREQAKLEAEREGLRDTLNSEPARDLVKYIKRVGKYKGHFVDLTPNQYRNLTGKSAKPSIIGKNGNVAWELAVDDVATEMGYSSDQALANAVERCRKMQKRIDDISAQLPRRKKVKARPNVCDPKYRMPTKCMDASIEGNTCKAKVSECEIDNKEVDIVAIRHPSQYSIHITKRDGTPVPTNQVGRVRYSTDADKEINAIRRAYQQQWGKPKRKRRKIRRRENIRVGGIR